ncbi:MAG: hypothetical protein J1F41_05705 [Lachnospiraceae bacterium]|nr:hypothetical protein [Lachnospiraceae bacterium]
MAIMDEFREEREALKNGTFKQKLQYFWDYYKWYVIIGVIVIAMASSFIHDILSNKEHGFFAVFLNTQEENVSARSFRSNLAERLNIDTDNYDVSVDTSMNISAISNDESTLNDMQRLSIYMSTGDLDVLAADSPTFLRYASTDMFYDLRDILSKEQLDEYSPYLYYVDMDEVTARMEASINEDDGYIAKEYDHHVPENMSDPVPIAICIQDRPKLQGVYDFPEGDVPMGFMINSSRLEEALAFLEYLFEDQIS